MTEETFQKYNMVFIRVVRTASESLVKSLKEYAKENDLRTIAMKQDSNVDNLEKNFNLSLNHIAYTEKNRRIFEDRVNKDNPLIFISAVRDPLRRSISHFQWNPMSKEMSYNEWYDKHGDQEYEDAGWYKNIWVKKVGNNPNLTVHPYKTNNYMSEYMGFNSLDEITEENLLSRYFYIFITEYLKKSLDIFGNKINFKFNEYNENSNDRELRYKEYSEIDIKIKKKFINNNQIDYKLYKLSKKLYLN